MGSLVLVDVLEIEVIHTSHCGGWEGVVLLQLVLAGQNTLESRYGHGGREEGCCWGIIGGGRSFLPEIIYTAQD